MKPRRDLENVELISHLVDGEAAAADWDELLVRADTEDVLLRRLVETQRDNAAIQALTRGAGAVAETVGRSRVTPGRRRSARCASFATSGHGANESRASVATRLPLPGAH